MTEQIISNYSWLINTLANGRYTLPELQQRWLEQKRGGELTTRTFHRWRAEIQQTMDIEIVCTTSKEGHFYTILRPEGTEAEGLVSEFVINTLSLSNIIADSSDISDKILLEPVPGGQQHLETIIEAIKMHRTLILHHRKFLSSETESHTIQPMGLKMHKQRWYLLAYSSTRRAARVFALDRIEKVIVTPFRFSEENKKIGSIKKYFADCYGVFHEHKPTQITIKTYGTTTNYLRTLPLHSSQLEIQPGIFRLFLRPEVDFISELLSHAAGVEVIEPLSLRKKMKRELRNMLNLYRTMPAEENETEQEKENNPDDSGKQ